MSDYDIHLYECDPGFDGCVEPYDNFHAPNEAFYSPTVNWDTIPTIPQFMDETYISAGYAELTDFQVEDQDREHTEFSTGLDAKYQEASEYTEEAPTGGNTENLHYDDYDGKHTDSNEHQQEQWLLSHSQTNEAAALPDMWWHDLSLDDKPYYEWAVNDPDKAADWENDWHHLHSNSLCTDDDDASHVTSGHVDAATYIHAKAPSPSLTNDGHNTELYAVTNVTVAYNNAAVFTAMTTHNGAPLCTITHTTHDTALPHSNYTRPQERLPHQQHHQWTPAAPYHPPHA
ncbi:hypothetical protein K439DRAFT_1618248 [Ramaria rubella]|nr:hypothetical protein K439DRAFT_1618248 [Ramaria rubella]